ncbi:MAG: hypothetical protein QE267_11365 [Akkermansiaceae bacterium]|nr:hypothetical protein [Akkermansiaceae bacterium]
MSDLTDATPPAVHIASSLLATANHESERRVQFHQACCNAVWHNESVSPEVILAALGTNAASCLQAAAESVRHVEEIAAISGLRLDDVLAASSREMPHEVILHEDGSATPAQEGQIDTPSEPCASPSTSTTFPKPSSASHRQWWG